MTKPVKVPQRAEFSSGPCSKRPGWSLDALKNAALGRSHRSKLCKTRLKEAIDLTREVLEVPDTHVIGIVPASDTGAVEMAMWSMLGGRPVDMCAWESFGKDWVTDVAKQLKLEGARFFTSDYGILPDLSKTNPDHDIVFTWNGTTAGVRVPDADWISDDRTGLTICDATSAAFAMDLPYDKLDVVTYSWQKVMGGEAAHGVLILSPRAVARLESYTPPWPLPKLFRMTKNGKLNKGIFEGATINTPSMLCVEDYLDTLNWGKSVGGLKGLISRADANAAVVNNFAETNPNFDFLAVDPATRTNTGVCLRIVADWFVALSADDQAAKAKELASLLEKEGIAFDINAYRDAPPGLRIWCGATVDTADLEALMPWIDWALGEIAP